MTAPLGEVIFDHYVHFLGKPVARKVYRAEGFDKSVQVLQFANVFSGCTTFATLGVGRLLAAYSADFVEVVMVVDESEQEAERLLVDTLFAMLQRQLPIREGISVGGPAGVPGSASKDTLKVAFYFTEPVPFPPAFRAPNLESRVVLALPITAAEHEFVKAYGGAAFEERLEAKGIDPFEIRRTSAC